MSDTYKDGEDADDCDAKTVQFILLNMLSQFILITHVTPTIMHAAVNLLLMMM